MSDAAAPQRPDRRIPALLVLLSLGPIILAQRDLRARSASEVRGSRLLWRLGASNAVVALAYLRWGRR